MSEWKITHILTHIHGLESCVLLNGTNEAGPLSCNNVIPIFSRSISGTDGLMLAMLGSILLLYFLHV